MPPPKGNGLDAANIQPAKTTNQNNSADFKRLVRAFALRGHSLIRTKDGYTAIRWNLAKHLANHAEAVAFLCQIGGKYEL
jgi:hypothetical protein